MVNLAVAKVSRPVSIPLRCSDYSIEHFRICVPSCTRISYLLLQLGIDQLWPTNPGVQARMSNVLTHVFRVRLEVRYRYMLMFYP